MNRAAFALLLPLVALLLLVPTAVPAAAPSQYRPHAGDRFAYSEAALVSNGQGNYSGYTDEGYYNGSIAVTSVAPNATANATYQSAGTYQNSQGTRYPWSEHGAFSFSGITYLYVNGTDNQTGYTDPSVWFLMDNALAPGGTFTLLNTPMRVVSESVPFATPTSPTGYASAIFAEGNGTYQRNDGYGKFTATYNWKAYFDPGTGYALGYVVTETDSDGAGDGFTYTDTVTDTSTSFPVTSVAAPPTPPSSPGPSSDSTLVFVAVAVLVILVIVVVVALVLRARSRRAPLARHPTTPVPGAMPPYTPPAVRFIPSDQPTVQQVVIRETVKVPCRYCGTLMDSTALNCPKCGAPRT